MIPNKTTKVQASERGKAGDIVIVYGDGDRGKSTVYFHQNRVSGKAKNRDFADVGTATNKEQDQKAI
jgi:hypothetical protein